MADTVATEINALDDTKLFEALNAREAVADDEHPLNGTQVAADTTPPPPGNGFLEQWATFCEDTFIQLEEVCKQGLTPAERLVMFKTAFKFLKLGNIGADSDTFSNHPEILEELEREAMSLEYIQPFSAPTREEFERAALNMKTTRE